MAAAVTGVAMAHGTTTDLFACLEKMRAGDAAARHHLLARALDRLRRLARRMLGDFGRVRRFDDTDDVLQNALLRILRRLEGHTPATPAEFFASAAQEMRRELLDLVRHYYGPLGRGRREVTMTRADSSDSVGPARWIFMAETPDAARLMRWCELHEAVEQLPVAERCVFELRWYHGMTWAEVAGVLTVSEATAKRHWLAARLHLRAKMQFDGDSF